MAHLVLGTVQFGMNYGINNQSGQPDIDEVRGILALAKELGIRELDTAQGYGDAEEILGKTISSKDEFIVHSKFFLKKSNLHLKACLDVSLENLKIKKLGYFYFHKFSDFLIFKNNYTYEELNLINEFSFGLAVSLYDEEEFKMVLQCDFIKAIQLPYNIFDSSLEKIELMKIAHAKGIKLYCRSVFLQGLFFMEPAALPVKLQPFKQSLMALRELSLMCGFSITELALGFVKNRFELNGILIGVDTKEQLITNVSAWNIELPDIVLDKLNKLNFDNKELLLPKNWN